MSVADDKTRIMVTLTEDEIVWIDSIALRFRMTRSQVVGKCVADARDTLEMMDGLGLKPERIKNVIEFLDGLWNMRKHKVKVSGENVSLG